MAVELSLLFSIEFRHSILFETFGVLFCSRKKISIKMSDTFEKMMSQKGNRGSDQPSSSGGRPMHVHWSGYKKIQANGRVAALCNTCQKTLTNTAKQRLIKHRYCIFLKISWFVFSIFYIN